MPDNKKPLKNWTLGEAKEYCESQDCGLSCALYSREIGCPFGFSSPNGWDLSEKPKYTKEDIEKLKAIKVLYPKAETIYVSSSGTAYITFSNDRYMRTPIDFCSLEHNKALNINEVLESEC